MTDAITLRESTSYVEHRGHILDEMLRAERWSRRKVALAIGTTPTYINARMNGEVDLTFSDIEAIAPLLRMTAVDLFAELQEGAKNAPGPTAGSMEKSPLDYKLARPYPVTPLFPAPTPERSKAIA